MTALIFMAFITSTCVSAQQKGFINVEGASLSAKLSAAHERARSARAGRHWVGFGFPVRPNVAVDTKLNNPDGTSSEVGGVITGNVGNNETRNLGVFLLYGGGGEQPARVEVYNLDREHNYEGLPVYWLGKSDSSESLTLLRSLLSDSRQADAAATLTEAIALHDSPQAETILEEVARTGAQESARIKALLWLGRLPGHLPLLAEVAGNHGESMEVRREAISSIGKSRQPDALSTLQRLYDSGLERNLKEDVIDSMAKSGREEAAAALEKLAQDEKDVELSRRARARAMKASGEKTRTKGDKKMIKSVKGPGE
jgi:hypothetical protein